VIEATVRLAGRDVWLAGAVRGPVAEVPRVLERLAAFAPRGVGVGISFDEVTGLSDHFLRRGFEPLVPLTTVETAEVLGLAALGEVRVPNPAYLAVLEWAADRGLPVEPLEPSDEQYSQWFADHIGYVELVRRTLAERRLSRAPPRAGSADDYALAWDRTVARGRDSRRLVAARVGAIRQNAMRFAERVGRAAVIVDRERFDEVRRALGPTA
jgi:hypothetical protein